MPLLKPSTWLKSDPAPLAFGKDRIVPERQSSFLSRLTFSWLGPILDVGASRPLEKDDLWSLPPNRRTDALASLLESNFYSQIPLDMRPAHLQESAAPVHNEKVGAGSESFDEDDIEKGKGNFTVESRKGKPTGTKDDSKAKPKTKELKFHRTLLSAMNKSFFWQWWIGGILKLFADTLKTTTPLVTKVILTWLSAAFAFSQSDGSSPRPQGIGYGVGLAFALFAMQEAASLLTNYSMLMNMSTGLGVRTALIGSIFRKSLRLSGRARTKHSVGQITTMISSDSARIDLTAQYAHNLWTAPIQIIIAIALLINNLGYSALVGLGVLIIGTPVQFLLVRVMYRSRFSGVQFTDRRVRLTAEVLQGIRLIKLYAWEMFYSHQIGELRRKEIEKIRRAAIARAGLTSFVTMLPILASMLSFITYGLSGHELNSAIIFSSLQFFNIIRDPLNIFPRVFVFASDALVALNRIGLFLTAEELAEPYKIDTASEYAIVAEGSFTWETVDKAVGSKFDKAKNNEVYKGKTTNSGGPSADKKESSGEAKGWWTKKKKNNSILPAPVSAVSSQVTEHPVQTHDQAPQEKCDDDNPFILTDLKLKIPKGRFVAIVGRVGSGKSSLLQSLTGEMRKIEGEVVFGGSVAYVPQQAWIMNATLRENILFGRANDDAKFEEIVLACSLQQDIDMLPNGNETEIGEKGIGLSGGQKARVSLARAAYSGSDIVLLDDPLSAIDAHVGKAILENCFLDGPLASKTRILVTHALHVLPRTDYIYVMDGGKIAEEGTFQELMKAEKEFARLVDEYGGTEKVDSDEELEKTIIKGEPLPAESADKPIPDAKKVQKQLMSDEERNKGAVPLSAYAEYLKHAGGIVWAPVIILLLVLMQSASVGNNLLLGFWTSSSISGFSQSDYMGVYAALGISQAIFSFFASFTFSLVGLYASLHLFKAALQGVLRSPVSFFDTTPMGRIISRLSKDQDTLDTLLMQIMYQLLSTFSNVIGTVGLVFYTFPYLGIIFVPMSILYYIVASYYRKSSVETKRLDSLMRSALYSSYSETLTGLSTVRAYREQRRFVNTADFGLDLENRAYYMTISLQRWLSVRLDIFGNVLILGIALFAAGFRNTVNPAKTGVVLSYSLSITQVFSDMVSQFATNEQNMNAVERILVYVGLPREGKSTRPGNVSPLWPEKGEVTFTGVGLAYREGLPLVLKGVNFAVKSGEKIGIIGRTGAGKSSLLQALFRMVELQNGAIEIDGVNIQSIDLDTLRQRLALVPQDSTLFTGTLRENLDPQCARTDAEIITALRRAWLLPSESSPMNASNETKYGLDATVSDEGSNYSAGEKQLLALCRALLKNSKIIVLDEATSSVDAETDAKLQRTIQKEFASCTLLCIAHRLKTIVYYDRVLVMDAGSVAEFDAPLTLFDREKSIFRSLCNEAALTRHDIVRIREGAGIDDST